MLSRLAVFTLPLFFIASTVVAQQASSPVPHEIWRDAVEKLRSHETLTYNVDYRVKYLDERDTHSVSATSTQIRVPTDTMVGGIVWLKHGSIERFYDLGHVFVHDHENHTTTVYERHEADQAGVSGGHTSDLLYADFLNPLSLEGAINAAENVTLNNDRIEGGACWKFTLRFSTPKNTDSSVLTVWIDAGNSTVKRKSYVVHRNGRSQFTEWTFSQLTFDQASAAELKKRNQSYLNRYDVAEFEQSAGIDRAAALLAYREVVPDITGSEVTDERLQRVRLSDYDANVYILDFWHTGCFTCRSAMATYNDIYRQYQDSGLAVLGVNSTDGRESVETVRSFLSDRSIVYPTLLVDDEVDSLFGVTFQPTLYVLDHARRVIYAQIGFQGDRARLIDVIDNVLRGRRSGQ